MKELAFSCPLHCAPKGLMSNLQLLPTSNLPISALFSGQPGTTDAHIYQVCARHSMPSPCEHIALQWGKQERANAKTDHS